MTEGWDVIDELRLLLNIYVSTKERNLNLTVCSNRFVMLCSNHKITWRAVNKLTGQPSDTCILLNNTIIITDTRTNK